MHLGLEVSRKVVVMEVADLHVGLWGNTACLSICLHY